jgi:hypothetical protein
MTSVLRRVASAAAHPLSTAAYSFGLARGFTASMLRVAAGDQGPVIPGYLPGPLAAPVEENVVPADVVHLVHFEPDDPGPGGPGSSTGSVPSERR